MSGGKKPTQSRKPPLPTVRAGKRSAAAAQSASDDDPPMMPIVEVFGAAKRPHRAEHPVVAPRSTPSTPGMPITPTIGALRTRIAALETEATTIHRERDADAETIGRMLARVSEREEQARVAGVRANAAEERIVSLKAEIEELQGWGKPPQSVDSSVASEERVLAAEERVAEMARKIESQRSQLTELEARARANEVRAVQAEEALRSAKGHAVELVERVDTLQTELAVLESKARSYEARAREAEGNFAAVEKHASEVAQALPELQRSAQEARDGKTEAETKARDLEAEIEDLRAELDVARARIEVERRKGDAFNLEMQREREAVKQLRNDAAQSGARALELDETRAKTASLERVCDELQHTLAKVTSDQAEVEATLRAEHEKAFARARLEFESTVKALEGQREESRRALAASERRVEEEVSSTAEVRRELGGVNERLAARTLERDTLAEETSRVRAALAASEAHLASLGALVAGSDAAIFQGAELLVTLQRHEEELVTLRERTLQAARGWMQQLSAVSRAIASTPGVVVSRPVPVRASGRPQASSHPIGEAKTASTPPNSGSDYPEPRIKQRQQKPGKRRK